MSNSSRGLDHYDLTKNRRIDAVRKGAIELDRRATVKKWDELGYRRQAYVALPPEKGSGGGE